MINFLLIVNFFVYYRVNVRLEEYNISSEIDCISHGADGVECNESPLNVAVEEEIPHENYSQLYKNDDKALIRLSKEVNCIGISHKNKLSRQK